MVDNNTHIESETENISGEEQEQSQDDNDTLGYAELTSDELKAAFR